MSLHDDIAAMLPRLRRFARALCYQRELADDLVQTALERALTHSAQWQAGTRLDSWLFRIIKNVWIDHLRAHVRESAVFAPEETGEHVPGDSGDALDQRLAIEQAMRRLPDEQRVVVALVLIEGLSYDEAAAVLEIPVGTVTSRLVRGRNALQAHLMDETRSVR